MPWVVPTGHHLTTHPWPLLSL